MSEAGQRLDSLMSAAFDANHPAMLDYVALKFELKAVRTEAETYKKALELACRDMDLAAVGEIRFKVIDNRVHIYLEDAQESLAQRVEARGED